MYDTPSIKYIYIYIRMYDTPSIKYIYISVCMIPQVLSIYIYVCRVHGEYGEHKEPQVLESRGWKWRSHWDYSECHEEETNVHTNRNIVRISLPTHSCCLGFNTISNLQATQSCSTTGVGGDVWSIDSIVVHHCAVHNSWLKFCSRANLMRSEIIGHKHCINIIFANLTH